MSSTPYTDLWLEQSHLNEIMLGAVSYGVFTCCGFDIDLCTSKGGSMYDIVVLVAIESAVLYSVFAIMFIVLFAVHSDVSNLCFLPISQWSCPGHCRIAHHHSCSSRTENYTRVVDLRCCSTCVHSILGDCWTQSTLCG